jgi:hypothetical protein
MKTEEHIRRRMMRQKNEKKKRKKKERSETNKKRKDENQTQRNMMHWQVRRKTNLEQLFFKSFFKRVSWKKVKWDFIIFLEVLQSISLMEHLLQFWRFFAAENKSRCVR